MNTLLGEDYFTVAEAATFLHVSQSTIWRWIEHDELPAYRVGQRRVWVKKADLERLVTPARSSRKGGGMAHQEAALPRPLTEEGREKALAALEAARRLRNEMLAQRGGKLFSDSSELIEQMRKERSHQLQ
ncbi:MAG: helix-turn-helix domain-containing protein [Dehalococcoidia bacterium]|nr:helix-turn-helix domain-containing protein [Dehalococcoidia bacterium]